MEELKPISARFQEEISPELQAMIEKCTILHRVDPEKNCQTITICYTFEHLGVKMSTLSYDGKLSENPSLIPNLSRSMGEDFYRLCMNTHHGIIKIEQGDLIIFISDTGEDIRFKFQTTGDLLLTEEELVSLYHFPFVRITISGEYQNNYYFKQGLDGAMLLRWMMWKIHEEAMKKVEEKV